MKRVRAAAIAFVLAVTTGCGSTLLTTGRGAANQPDQQLSSTQQLPGSAPSGTGNPALNTTGTSQGSAGSATGAQQPAATSGASGTGPAGVLAHDHSPVLIGYITSHDAEQVYSSLGVTSADFGDIDAEAALAAKDVNAHGGLLGHPIKLLDHDFSTAGSTTNPDAEQQKACTDFTQDHHVAAVADTLGISATIMMTCLAKAGIPLFIDFGGAYSFRSSDFRGPIFGPSLMPVDVYAPAIVRGLMGAGWFGRWDTAAGQPSKVAPVRLGIMHYDDPQTMAYVQAWKKTAAALGYPITDDVAYSQDVNEEAANTQNAVLKFKADGITHVINANILFYKDAQTQNYHPRYEVDDIIDTPQLLTQNVDASQLHGSMGVGYRPLDEVNNPADMSASTTRCRRIMAAGGQRPPGQLAQGFMLGVCDQFWLMQQLVDRGGGFSLGQLDNGADAVGAGFLPALTYGATVSSQAHAPANTVRTFAYQDGCGCFTYVDKPRHI